LQPSNSSAKDDFNGDGRVDFRDFDHAQPLTPPDPNRETRSSGDVMRDVMERQRPDYAERVRNGKTVEY
jgi:hypothetical protein